MRLEQASLVAPIGLDDLISETRTDPGWSLSKSTGDDTKAILRRLIDHSQGVNLPAGWVPATTFWLIDDNGRAVGFSNLRHRLVASLMNRGGHIAYYIGRDWRGKGFGKVLLALTLDKAAEIGIARVLVTIQPGNVASIKVTEANGGVLEDEAIDPASGLLFRRYWVNTVEHSAHTGPR
jgi:predicted acetyltransferase